jgi:hypothetical protein
MSKLQQQAQQPHQDLADALIDTMQVCASKDGRVYLQCSMHGRRLFFPMTRADASRTASELVYFVAILEERDQGAPAPRARKRNSAS